MFEVRNSDDAVVYRGGLAANAADAVMGVWRHGVGPPKVYVDGNRIQGFSQRPWHPEAARTRLVRHLPKDRP